MRLTIIMRMMMVIMMTMVRTLDWVFVRGVRAQLESLRQGFTSVFPMDKLGSFTPAEVRQQHDPPEYLT